MGLLWNEGLHGVAWGGGHILSPYVWPLAIGEATELFLALPETFLSLQGDLTLDQVSCIHLFGCTPSLNMILVVKN